jgi:hypothetical protein
MNVDVIYFHRDGMLGADSQAMTAILTLLPVPEWLHLGQLALGIGAPLASERTALEKDYRPDAWSIIHAELLDVEDNAFLLKIHLRHISSHLIKCYIIAQLGAHHAGNACNLLLRWANHHQNICHFFCKNMK